MNGFMLLCVLSAPPQAPVPPQAPAIPEKKAVYVWKKVEGFPDFWRLFRDDEEQGVWDTEKKVYRPWLESGKLGKTCICPIDPFKPKKPKKVKVIYYQPPPMMFRGGGGGC